METDVIVFLINAVMILWLGAGAALALAKGLPLAIETVDQFKRLVLALLPPLRRLFDPNTALSNALKAKGINPTIADNAAEMAADLIEQLLAGLPREVNVPTSGTGATIAKAIEAKPQAEKPAA